MKSTPILSFLTVAALGALILVSAPAAEPAKAKAAKSQAGLQALADNAWDVAKARHLLFRAGFGGTPEEVEKLHAMGLRKAVDFLVDYKKHPDVDMPMGPGAVTIDPIALVKLSPEERANTFQKGRANDQQYMTQVRHWWVKRMVQSPRPLEEKLVLFWHGHFAAEWRTVRNSATMAMQNQLFREHANGNFGKLLHQIIYDPAMLRYLDNNTNVKGKANQNLAREIMELFAMGESQGYTETDVIEGARALTGYTFDAKTLKATFIAGNHDTTEKTIFGKKGNWNGDQFVDLILEQPATSRFMAWKFFTYYVHENPSDENLAQMAKLLKDNNYELAPVLKNLFQSQEFYSQRAIGTQIKSPAQFVVGIMRVLQVKEYNPESLAQAMRTMNQDLFEPPNVKGWDGGQTWVNSVTLFGRHNFVSAFVERGIGGTVSKPDKTPTKPTKPMAGLPAGVFAQLDPVELLKDKKLDSSAAVVDYLARALYAVPITDAKRTQFINFLGDLPPSSAWADKKRDVNQKIGNLLILMMCMPEFQLT